MTDKKFNLVLCATNIVVNPGGGGVGVNGSYMELRL